MAVIYVPEDKRWSQLGTALGSLAGTSIGKYQQSEVDKGVAQIQADPDIPAAQKLTAIQQKYGSAGMLSLTNSLKASALQAQIAAAGGEQALTAEQTRKLRTANDITDQTLPAQLAAPAAQLATEKAKTQLLGAQTAATAAEVPLRQAQTGNEDIKGNLLSSEARKTDAEASILDAQAQATKALAADPSSLDARIKQLGITDPQQQDYVKSGFLTGGLKGFQAAAKDVVDSRMRVEAAKAAAETRNAEPKQTPEPQLKQAGSAAAQAKATENFLDNFLKNPDVTGLAGGAPVKAWLEGKGFSTGDPALLGMYENSLQQIGLKATAGGGFFTQGRVNLAKDLTANLSKSPLGNLVAMDTVADQNLTELRTAKAGLAPNQNTKPLDMAIEQWEKIKSRTGTLESFVDHTGKSIVSFEGNQVDPKTLKPILKGDEQVKVQGGTMSGANILYLAKERKQSPQEVIAALIGGSP